MWMLAWVASAFNVCHRWHEQANEALRVAISPARGPPLWDDGDAQMDDGVQIEPDWATDWDGAAQAAPDFEVDQRINW